MNSLHNFLSMGGRGFYVWGAYGLTFLFLIAVVVWAAKARRHTTRQVLARARKQASSGKGVARRDSVRSGESDRHGSSSQIHDGADKA